MSIKNSNETIGNRIRNLPAFSAVPQPTAPPRAVYLDKWENDIELDLLEVGCGGLGWIDLAKDRNWWRALVNALERPSPLCIVY